MANEKKSARQLKGLLAFIILILALMQSSAFINKPDIWPLLAIPYFLIIFYLAYHLAFHKYDPNEIMDHVLFFGLLTTIALVISPLTTLGAMTMLVVMILVARLAINRGKI